MVPLTPEALADSGDSVEHLCRRVAVSLTRLGVLPGGPVSLKSTMT